MKPRTLAFILVGLYLLLTMCSCANQTQTAAKLQTHIAGAKTSSVATGTKISQAQGSLSRADYKAVRAKKLLDEVEAPF